MQFQDKLGDGYFKIELNALKFILQKNCQQESQYSMKKKTGRFALPGLVTKDISMVVLEQESTQISGA